MSSLLHFHQFASLFTAYGKSIQTKIHIIKPLSSHFNTHGIIKFIFIYRGLITYIFSILCICFLMLLSVYINVVSTGGDVMVALATYAAIVLGTATFNCILVQVLAMPLKKVLKR